MMFLIFNEKNIADMNLSIRQWINLSFAGLVAERQENASWFGSVFGKSFEHAGAMQIAANDTLSLLISSRITKLGGA